MAPTDHETRMVALYVVHDDALFLADSIASLGTQVPALVFVSRLPWNGEAGDWQKSAHSAESAGAKVLVGDWNSEEAHRDAACKVAVEAGYTHAITLDGDEIIESELLQTLIQIAQMRLAEIVHGHMDTYWKTPEYVIRPREKLTPIVLVDLVVAKPYGIRLFDGGRHMLLGPEYGVIHHLSYAGPNERILRKISTWSHKNEVLHEWYPRVWEQWDADKLMRNLHPTFPEAYGWAERIPINPLLIGSMPKCPTVNRFSRIASPPKRDSVSIVIPLCGGEEEIELCLQSLQRCREAFDEVVIVDNASPDDALSVARAHDFVTVIENKENTGFAHACNQGAIASRGNVVIFLNSDAIVPINSLPILLATLGSSANTALAAPHTNYANNRQRIGPTYTTLDNLELFADDFASRIADDFEVDALIGFCLAIRKPIFEELGGFDEEFGLGLFEDTDLCYRALRAGYKVKISARSYVHHHGSRTILRLGIDSAALLDANAKRYMQKWADDLSSGFVSGLPGLGPAVRFDRSRNPDDRRAELDRVVKRAQVSLCMIVRDEERVLSQALSSASPYFTEIIVVDTGSIDRTKEIALSFGAKVFDFPWTDSFSEARNESLKHATGKWIFWMDADDTLTADAGYNIVSAAAYAQRDVVGFVIPVQFVDEGPGAGTRVDHVKLFRNLPGVKFEGRIHEQVLGSLRTPGGVIARCNAVVHHSGYDTSDRGQEKKRERDFKLLDLDLSERPGHPFVLFNYGMTCHYTNDHERALDFLQRSIEASTKGESHLRKAHVLKAQSLRRLGKAKEAISALEEATRKVGDDAEILFLLGALSAEQGDLEGAKQLYERSLTIDSAGYFSSMDVGLQGVKAFHNLATVCLTGGDYQGAKGWWKRSLRENPAYLPNAFDLFKAALEQGDHVTSREVLDHVKVIEGESNNWVRMNAEFLGSVAGNEILEVFLQDVVRRSPDSVGLRMLLARHLLGKKPEAAIDQLLVCAEAGCAEAAYCLGVESLRRDQAEKALHWMQLANKLEPNNPETISQIRGIEAALRSS